MRKKRINEVVARCEEYVENVVTIKIISFQKLDDAFLEKKGLVNFVIRKSRFK